jgi:hypothetical protein
MFEETIIIIVIIIIIIITIINICWFGSPDSAVSVLTELRKGKRTNRG